MNLKSLLREMVLGSSLPNEYICLTDAGMTGGLRVILTRDRDELDVTEAHVLLGYKPLLMGFPWQDHESVSWAARSPGVSLSFRAPTLGNREIAWLELKKSGSWRMGDTTFLICEGLRGAHRFLNSWFQATNSIYERTRPRKPGNISLPPKLYTQVRIAYSIPRKISVISVGEDGLYNMFPSDLHGSVGKGFYAGSLRMGSHSSSQVEACKKILIADMGLASFKETYALGRHHMKAPQPLQPSANRSDHWQLPVPNQATAYKELRWKDSWESGIHRVHFYEVVGEKVLDVKVPRLCHVHRYYAQWRINHQLTANYFLR